jgi:RNA polymerase sigma-70 factor (ECF subfamily)
LLNIGRHRYLSPIGMMISNQPTAAVACEPIVDLYDQLRPALHAYLCGLGMTSEQSEDVIQETFLRLVRNQLALDSDCNRRAWVFRVAHNLSMDVHRSQKRSSLSNDDELHPVVRERADPRPNPERQAILDEQMKRLERAVGQLTPKQRQCVLLRAEGFRYREIANTLGISVQRVGELMQRSILLLEVNT